MSEEFYIKDSDKPGIPTFPRGVKAIIENTMTTLVIMGLTPDEAETAMKKKFPSLVVKKETE